MSEERELVLYYEQGDPIKVKLSGDITAEHAHHALHLIRSYGAKRRPRPVVLRGPTSGMVVHTRGLRAAVLLVKDQP